MIEQLAFESFEPNPKLILLGPDPERSGRWLVRCSECGKIRSIVSRTNAAIRARGNSICIKCGNRLAGLAKIKPIPINQDCIVLDPLSLKDPKFKFYFSLVSCPDCKKTFYKNRMGLLRDKHTICLQCAQRRRALVLESTPDCIILKQFIEKPEPNRIYFALVQCPTCGLVFERSRDHLHKAKHSFCQSCAYRGERCWRWQGGYPKKYGLDWHVISRRIRERDLHTCQYPGCDKTSQSESRNLDVHHIIPLLPIHDIATANAALNLVTLCIPHHRWADGNYDVSIPLLKAIAKERTKTIVV